MKNLIKYFLLCSIVSINTVQSQSYCCCNDHQCLGGDSHHCCTHPDHRHVACGNCTGVTRRGWLATDSNPCNNQDIDPCCFGCDTPEKQK